MNIEDLLKHQNNNSSHITLRETSRTRLQRLGALYSNPNDLSSPIHQNEGKFHAEKDDTLPDVSYSMKQHKRHKKLDDLANTISQWEDELTDQDCSTVLKKPTETIKNENKVISTKKNKVEIENNELNFKQNEKLKWDRKIIDSLEAQGFHREEFNGNKLSYTYSTPEEKTKKSNKMYGAKNHCDKELHLMDISSIKQGFIAKKTSVLENKVDLNNSTQFQVKKDPTELSLKERMNFFEKYKGEAPMPKAAFGIAPSLKQIRSGKDESLAKREIKKGMFLLK